MFFIRVREMQLASSPPFSITVFSPAHAFRMHVALIAYHELKASHPGEIARLREEGRFFVISFIIVRLFTLVQLLCLRHCMGLCSLHVIGVAHRGMCIVWWRFSA